MNEIKINNLIDVKTSTGLQSLEGIELKFKTVNIDFSQKTSNLRCELFANENENSLPLQEINNVLSKIELDNDYIKEALLSVVINKLENTIYSSEFISDEETINTYYSCINLLVKNTIWHNDEVDRNIRIFVTWRQASIIAEFNPEFLLDVKNNATPSYSSLSGKFLYMKYIDESGTFIEDTLKSLGIYIERK